MTNVPVAETVLELRGITKLFPGVKALDSVHFDLRRGEIHALMGENGAGKSTLIKVISGVHQPDGGQIFLDGEERVFRGTKDARDAGIATIYQHVTSYPQLSVAENIFTGHELVKRGVIQWKEMYRRSDELLRELGADFKSTDEIEALSVAQQQMVEIAKALALDSRIIIMDEPTAALTKQESEHLYTITERLRDNGTSVIFISHRFEDMYRLASRVTVFRDAQYIGTYQVDEIERSDLIKAMVGRETSELFPKSNQTIGEEALRVENLSLTGYFHDVSFHVSKGEILGVIGLVGARRTEVMQTVFGARKPTSGTIYVNGKKVQINHPQDAMKHGIGLLTEDRQHQGLILDWSIKDNITLPIISELGSAGMMNEKAERSKAKSLAEKLSVKAKSIFTLAKTLSGGNQQKVVVAKLLASDLDVLILDEPTKGVDVGAKAQIYEIISELANLGYAIIMVSSEMPEILGMSDRIMVMCEGRVSGFLTPDATQEEILQLAMTKVEETEATAS